MDPFTKSKIFGADSNKESIKASPEVVVDKSLDLSDQKTDMPTMQNTEAGDKKPVSKIVPLLLLLIIAMSLGIYQSMRLSSAQKDLISVKKATAESINIEKDKYQAVFLKNGQTYFGKMDSLNETYLTMSDIYYLRQTQAISYDQTRSAATDFSLVKLGCEIHSPRDKMIINRQEVSFWENLNKDGRVAKAFATYRSQTPEQQKCPT